MDGPWKIESFQSPVVVKIKQVQKNTRQTVHVDRLIPCLTPQAVDQPVNDSLPELFGEREWPSPVEPSLPPDDIVEETQDLDSQLMDVIQSSQRPTRTRLPFAFCARTLYFGISLIKKMKWALSSQIISKNKKTTQAINSCLIPGFKIVNCRLVKACTRFRFGVSLLVKTLETLGPGRLQGPDNCGYRGPQCPRRAPFAVIFVGVFMCKF